MMEKQIKDLAWNTFKQTGNIDTFMELMQVENIEKNAKQDIAKNVEETQYGNIKNEGIILSESNMNDFDKMVTILTPNGKIGCAAKGARRPKSLLMSGTQFLCFGEYLLYQSSNSYHMNSCDTIEVFYNIRTDLDKLKYASYITKIINDVTDEIKIHIKFCNYT